MAAMSSRGGAAERRLHYEHTRNEEPQCPRDGYIEGARKFACRSVPLDTEPTHPESSIG